MVKHIKLLLLFLIFSTPFTLKAQSYSLDWVQGIRATGFFTGNANSLSTDSNNNIYIGGRISGTTFFDPSNSSFSITPANQNTDGFVAKYTPNRNLVWAKNFRCFSNGGFVNSIHVAKSGAIYIGGQFSDTVDADPGVGEHLLFAQSDIDMFIIKLNPNGDFEWAFNVTGAYAASNDYSINAIRTDANENVFVAGVFEDTADFDPSSNIAQQISPRASIFIAKYDSSGNYKTALSAGLAGTRNIIFDMELDADANVYVCGKYNSSVDFDPGNGVATLSLAGAFLASYDSVGNYRWVKSVVEGNAVNSANSLELLVNGDIMVCGSFRFSPDFDPSSNKLEITSKGDDDLYLSKFDSQGNLKWVNTFGSTKNDGANSIAVNNEGEVFITGYYRDTVDFDPDTLKTSLLIGTIGTEMFLTAYDSTGGYLWGTSASGAFIQDIKRTEDGLLYLCGETSSTSFQHNSSVKNINVTGNGDKFFMRLNPCFSATVPTISSTKNSVCSGDSITLSISQNDTLNSSQTWALYSGSCGATAITQSVNGVFTVSPIQTTTYYIRGEGGCADTGKCGSITIDFNNIYSVNLGDTNICEGDSIMIFGEFRKSTGTYYDSLSSQSGCDSTLALQLTVNSIDTTVLGDISICFGDSTLMFGNYQKQAGTYYNTLTSTKNCDSIVQQTLIVNTVDTGVNRMNSYILAANASGALYTWIDCNNNTSVSGATNQVFVATANGSYAVEITENGCVDTSSCYTIIGVSVQEPNHQTIKVYPNPVSKLFTVELGEKYTKATLLLTDINGRELLNKTIIETTTYTFDMSEFSNGVYLLSVSLDDEVARSIRIVKE